MSASFKLGELTIGDGSLFLIAGPCVIESEEHAVKMAECIAGVARALKIPYIFKASYDKANRTSLKSYRGPGMKEGLAILRKIAETVHVPVLTDVHDAHDVATVAEYVDMVQIPAFLCRQTDLLVAAAKSGRAVNIKKGQFVSPWDMRHAVEKVRESGNDRVLLTERGSSFGYNNLVVDMRSLPIMRQFAPVVFDATHSVQLPSAGPFATPALNSVGPGASPGQKQAEPESKMAAAASAVAAVVQSGGQPEFIPMLARAAVAAGVDGVFVEVHDNPAAALSDGANALDLKWLRPVLHELQAVHEAVRHSITADQRA
jgi:2-dehydro-3-deoxyphosphooctonate aldolase (KDO 8-P synthase)